MSTPLKKLFTTGVCFLGVTATITLIVLFNLKATADVTENIVLGRRILKRILSATDYNDSHSLPQTKEDDAQNRLKGPTEFYNLPSALPEDIIHGVQKFVFFIGYPRSGHSIVGSLMDAHPNMVIAHEFMLFKRWITDNQLRNKSYLFNALFMDSYKDATVGLRTKSSNSKGYSLDVGFPWQGRYDQQLLVIGDKSGGKATFKFMENSTRFKHHYQQLLETVNIPVRVIHVVRNPYDIISTSTLYKQGIRFVANLKALFRSNETRTTAKKFNDEYLLAREISDFFKRATAVTEMIEYIGSERILEVHNSDLVNSPKGTLLKICTFLQVDCPVDYLEAVEQKVFQKVSQTRKLVEWPLRLQQAVEREKESCVFISQYSFDSDI